ncbi:hypothetical protein VI06_10520 [Aquitalea magnusonii]|nr:hypothetical protein VI06_10520 [Aquitalea magnusonii]
MTTETKNIGDIYSFLDAPVAPKAVRLVANEAQGFKLVVEFENGVDVLPLQDGKPVQWRTIEQAIGDLSEASIDRSRVILDISEWY